MAKNWKDKVNDMVFLVGDTHWLATVAAACRKAGEAIPWEQSYLKAIAEDIDNLVVTRFESGRTEPEEVFKGTALAPKRDGDDVSLHIMKLRDTDVRNGRTEG